MDEERKEKERIIGHIIVNKSAIYIHVPQRSELYKLIRNAVEENGGSARGLRIELEICNARVRRVKLE